jgi:sec-independent protein translocase protein TatA
MFTLGVPEMAVIFILALVLFGPKKLPELGRTIGKAMTEFRRASNDLKANFDGTPAIETASTQSALEAPAPVGASEVSGAESTPTAEITSAEPVLPGIKAAEGTIPRSGSLPRPSRRVHRQVSAPETKNS